MRQSAVWNALQWLSVNHSSYGSVTLSAENLRQYDEDDTPVSVVYREVDSAEDKQAAECLSVHHVEDAPAPSDGPCEYAVHALTAEQLQELPKASRIAKAIDHIRSGHKVLAYGHGEDPQSIFRNPLLLPGMFPWLFPYGLGGLDNDYMLRKSDFSRAKHIQHFLLYHDRRFQLDDHFVFVLHSHNAVRAASTGGYLLAKMHNFDRVADTILKLKPSALAALVERGQRTGTISAENEDEKACFEIMHWVTHAGGRVPYSAGRKKEQRNEIRSLIYHLGTPMFFITFSPADIKSPICLYYAGAEINLFESCPTMPNAAERLRAIAQNPTAGARFFHKMVCLFIKHILQWDSGSDGVFGRTSGYYITVEAQGRMTLHAHGLIYIFCPLSLQEIRERAMSDMPFQREMISWLESICSSGLSSQVVSEIAEDDPIRSFDDSTDPSLQLPTPPPLDCSPEEFVSFLDSVLGVVDRLALRNHLHVCGVHCQRYGECRARFPRTTIQDSFFDEQGALHLKHKESMMNVFNFILTYLIRSNTDVTCLLSGTQVRAIIGYVTDYVTKSQLKTYTLLDTMRSVLDKHGEVVKDIGDNAIAARMLLVKTLNALHAKLETGGPMICASLLGNPDHYKSHVFKPLYWYTFMAFVAKQTSFPLSEEIAGPKYSSVVVGTDDASNVVPVSHVADYIFRGDGVGDLTLYDFYRVCTIERSWANKRQASEGSDDESDDNASTPTPSPANRPYVVHRFHDGHHRSDSRVIHAHKDVRLNVVDFRGNRLPRACQSDELYCLTMLMLFKPGGWRSGSDLKDPSVSWRAAFDSTLFSPHARKIMANMNLLYECQDARDDYSAQRRRERSNTLPAFGLQDLNELDVQRDVDVEIDANMPSDTVPLPEEDEASDHVRWQMEEMQGRLQRLQAAPQASGPLLSVQALPTSGYESFSSKHWKSVLTKAKRAVIDARKNLMADVTVPPDLQAIGSARSLAAPNTVCVISPLACTMATHADYIRTVGNEVFTSDLVTPMMKDICAHFTLNREQVRAFVTIASAVTTPGHSQLKMYLGGMGGTGKSQVIKSLTAFFTARRERRRLLLMAPTGAAACLIGGSTYHSMLGITISEKNRTPAVYDTIRENLAGVDVLFIDELSMISSSDLSQMSANVAKALNKDDAFGGLHIVLAGDFCQLPPAGQGSVPLYSRKTFGRTSNAEQARTMGCVIWQQFTCVVILRENMRQLGMSTADRQFREALTHVRLCLCTDDDLALFRSRVSGLNAGLPQLLDPDFERVSMITALNAHRDIINTVNAVRFARARNQNLFYFHSRDKYTSDTLKHEGGPNIPARVQDKLWRVPPCSLSKPIPGILPLCVGMPVMVKYNEATELCVTNGAEGLVVGWIADTTPSQRLTLRVLFIELINPASPVKLPDLPPNVVPIAPRTHYLYTSMPGKPLLKFARVQVSVLLNFAMTDYSSQGRTRPINIVDPSHCRTTQSVYTCLSRGASLEGLLLLNDFQGKNLKGGLNGDLRDELNDLELLCDISKLRYEGSLHQDVNGSSRRELLRNFRAVYGKSYVATHAHELRSSASTNKRSADGPPPSSMPVLKLPRLEPSPPLRESPVGMRWDPLNHSCAYDSLLTVVVNTSHFFPSMWDSVMGQNAFFDYFWSCLRRTESSQVVTTSSAQERARDELRDALYHHWPKMFPRFGQVRAEVDDVARVLTTSNLTFGRRLQRCIACSVFQENTTNVHDVVHLGYLSDDGEVHEVNVSSSLQEVLFPSIPTLCPHCCARTVVTEVVYHSPPSVLGLELPLRYEGNANIDRLVTFPMAGEQHVWELTAVIYLGNNHFSSRFIDDDGFVWYHDGIETGSVCTKDAESMDEIGSFSTTRGLRACLVLYRLLLS